MTGEPFWDGLICAGVLLIAALLGTAIVALAGPVINDEWREDEDEN